MDQTITIEQLRHAGLVAWLLTTSLGIVVGVILYFAYRPLRRRTGMAVLSGLISGLMGVAALVVLEDVRYRIEEKPFEPPVWIDPGPVAIYSPAVGVVIGVLLALIVTRKLHGGRA